jgi:hypothetical protein
VKRSWYSLTDMFPFVRDRNYIFLIFIIPEGIW